MHDDIGEHLEPAVLFISDRSRASRPVHSVLEHRGINIHECRSMQELVERIASGSGPVVLSVSELNAEDAELLLKELRSQPYWSDVPVILLESGATSVVPEELRRQRGTTFLKQPIEDEVLTGVVQTAIETRLRQLQVRDLLHHLEDLHQKAAVRARHLQQLSMKLATAEHDERTRIAGVIHDEFQQLLVAARMRLGSLQGIQGGGGMAEMAEGCREVDELLREAIQSARGLTRQLSPPVLRHGGLRAALSWLIQTSRDRHDLRIDAEIAPAADEIDRSIQLFMFEAARELIFNVVKHANTLRASLDLKVTCENALLSVKDDGSGFDPSIIGNDAEAPQGLGLFGISERAALLGGNLRVQSHPGGGCEVDLAIPLAVQPKVSKGTIATAIDPEFDPGQEDDSSAADGRKRVLVVDDHRIVRQGIASMLAHHEDILVIGEASDGQEALEKARALKPDVILMDVSMPGMNGIDATRAICNEMDEIDIIGLSMFEMEEIGQQMLDAGARCYLPKSGPAQALLEEIRSAV